MLDKFEICVSYTGVSAELVHFLDRNISDLCETYVYETQLDQQTGFFVKDIALRLYSTLPCIVFATHDWHTRPATVFEFECLRLNESKKLIFDFCGNFSQSKAGVELSNLTYGLFLNDGSISLQTTRCWILALAQSS